MGGGDVVDVEEEPDAPGPLVTDRHRLALAVGPREQHPGARARRTTTTQRFGRPPVDVVAGESSTSSNPTASTKKRIASS